MRYTRVHAEEMFHAFDPQLKAFMSVEVLLQ